MYAQPTLIIPLLVRRYIAWTERGVVQACMELEIEDLHAWHCAPVIPPGVDIRPLPEFGREWLIRKLYNQSFFDSPGYRPATPLHIMALRAAPHHDPHSIFLAREGKQYAGFCIGRCRPGGRGLINGLGTRPEFRGRGVARALLRTTLQHLKDRGAPSAVIRVHPENYPARQLYLSEGFSVRPGAEG